MTERLNFESVLKSTLSGSEFHTLTTRSCEFAFTYVCITSCKLSAYTFVMCKINATYLEMGQLLTVNNYLIKYVNWNYSYIYVKLNRPRT